MVFHAVAVAPLPEGGSWMGAASVRETLPIQRLARYVNTLRVTTLATRSTPALLLADRQLAGAGPGLPGAVVDGDDVGLEGVVVTGARFLNSAAGWMPGAR